MPQTRRSGPARGRSDTFTLNQHSTQQADIMDLLWDGPVSTVERFRTFHSANGHIYSTLVRLARQWLEKTRGGKLGIAMLWEAMRWDVSIQTGEAPKLNNNLKAYYARLIMAREPDLADVFYTRSSAADDAGPAAALGETRD